MTSLLLRPARPSEAFTVRRLAVLHGSLPLRGEVILAFAGERPVAAVSLLDGRLVADPCEDGMRAAELLREHADGLRAGRGAAARSAARAVAFAARARRGPSAA